MRRNEGAPRRPVVAAAFTLSWDGRMVERRLPEGPVDAVLCGGKPDQRPLRKALEHLRAAHGARRVAFAGSPELFRELAAGGLLDELSLAWRPCILGGKSAPPITDLEESFLPQGIVLDLVKLERAGDECLAKYRVQPPPLP